MTDVEIAKTMNINSTSVFEWRKKNNLELNAIKIKALLMMRNL
jgi:hypothetical protein